MSFPFYHECRKFGAWNMTLEWNNYFVYLCLWTRPCLHMKGNFLILFVFSRYHRLPTARIYFQGSYLPSKVKTYGKIRSFLYYVPESNHAYVTQTKSTAWLNDIVSLFNFLKIIFLSLSLRSLLGFLSTNFNRVLLFCLPGFVAICSDFLTYFIVIYTELFV